MGAARPVSRSLASTGPNRHAELDRGRRVPVRHDRVRIADLHVLRRTRATPEPLWSGFSHGHRYGAR